MIGTSQRDSDLFALMREAVECLPNGFCLFDRDFRPIIANRIALEVFHDFFAGIASGLPYRQVHFAEVRVALRNATDDECWQIADRVIAHARAGTPIDLKARDGRIFRTIYQALSGEFYAAVYLDRTESLQRKTKLEVLRREIEAGNHTKSVFLAELSHAMRTPLTSVLGMAQILAGSELALEDREQVEIILESGEALNALLENLIDISRIEAGQIQLAPTNCDLDQIIKHQCGLSQRSANVKGVRLKLQIASGLPARMYFDPAPLAQCLFRLISSAIRSIERGQVRVVVTSREMRGQILITVVISASGVGMRRGGNNSDRNILIARKLAEFLGGDVHIESEMGIGSTFTLTLTVEPARIGQQSEVSTTKQPESSATTREVIHGKRVLLVDDQPLNRRVVRLFLEPVECQITEAENGKEALAALEQDAFDLVLLDIYMPVLDGWRR